MSKNREYIPVHIDPSRDDRIAKAPFSFVRLPNEVYTVDSFDCFDQYVNARHSGYIDVIITCESPTYIQCGFVVGDDANNAGSNSSEADFFHHGNPMKPVIPGSSVRGMIRTLVEVMSFGKMQWLSDRKLVYRAVAGNDSLGEFYRKQFGQQYSRGVLTYPSENLKAGYLRKDPKHGYIIQPAVEHCGVSFVRVDYKTVEHIARPGISDVKDVWVKPEPSRVHEGKKSTGDKGPVKVKMALATKVSTTQETPDMIRGSLVVTAELPGSKNMKSPTRKHMHCIVYEVDNEAAGIPIPRDKWTAFEDDQRLVEESGGRRLLYPEKGDAPVFYITDRDGNLVFFGPTMMFRLIYPYAIIDYVPADLRDEQKIDLAEAVFGTVSKNKAIRSRVSFSDFNWVDDGGNPYWDDGKMVSPRVLSSPKPTAFQEYLVQTEPDDIKKLLHWGSGPENTVIRGHKFYWHKEWSAERYWEKELVEDAQHKVIRPVKAGSKFQGRIRFENLSDMELGALLLAIELRPDMRHKLGMGKPLAMGTVHVEGDLKLVDRKTRYSSMFDEDSNIIRGELESVDVAEVRKFCVNAFKDAMVEHHNRTRCSKDETADAVDFWQIPRFGELVILLSKDHLKDADHGGYFDYPPMAEDGAFDGKYWSKRPVVMSPQGLVRYLQRGNATNAHRTLKTGLGREFDVGIEIEAVICEETTKKGKLLVQLSEGLRAVVVNSDAVPPSSKAGDKIRVRYKADGYPYAQAEWIDKY